MMLMNIIVTGVFIGYEMNVFKLSLYFSHVFQMQMLRRFRIVTHCYKNCTATRGLGKQNSEGNDPKLYNGTYTM